MYLLLHDTDEKSSNILVYGTIFDWVKVAVKEFGDIVIVMWIPGQGSVYQIWAETGRGITEQYSTN